MTISEHVAYIQGLAEGLELEQESKEGRILSAVLEVLGDMAQKLQDLEENDLNIGDELDALSDDLAAVEDIVYDEDEDEEDDGDYMYATVCPNCGEEIELDESLLEQGTLECPNCGETLELAPDEDEEEE